MEMYTIDKKEDDELTSGLLLSIQQRNTYNILFNLVYNIIIHKNTGYF